MALDFSVDADLRDLALRTRRFVDELAIHESGSQLDHGFSPALIDGLRAGARAAGVFAPTVPVALGGLGLSHCDQALVLEESGRSVLGPVALNCAAPDEGNILLLDRVANEMQREQYLAPLARGDLRSCFAMTEPAPGAGSDPASLLTVARREGGRWHLDGRKWFITGAVGAAFAIVMARTGARAATLFLVGADNPGWVVRRTIGSLDQGFSGGHAEIELRDCVVGNDAVLGAVDQGFAHAQIRLAPARLTHCMRWLGAARRCHETAVAYAQGREMFGTHAASLGMVQAMLADNEIDIAASRALVWRAAYELDTGRAARAETSVAKTYVAEAVGRIVDRSMQVCGAFGVSDDAQIARIYREVRPFRIYDGPSEVHRQSIARRAVRRSEQGLLPGDWFSPSSGGGDGTRDP
jgi:acyl-CoA dehydrogenase